MGKTLANCNKLSLSLIKTRHAKFKTTIVYFIITCGIKIVCAFAVSSVVKGNTWDDTNIKIISAPNDRA